VSPGDCHRVPNSALARSRVEMRASR
jgi:hypothetical protein